ncbi:hypothetical protein N657DRAFT_632862 [Parathielavia appendiculata]|uniref:Uncharacterized protein n=1 Tax=Parathielavia appendiculata TaxID=2587402 RepID=A0AAN6Z4Q3_9PEZI|nr:hypothetical protein N657DRAFT_632862 [Parathielavia appendiculata]
MYLPDRFKQATTELEDGTIIVLHHGGGGEKVQREEPVIQVKPTTADDNPNEEPLSNDQRPSHEDKGDHDTDGSSVRQQLTTETKGGSKSKSKASKNGKGSESPQQPMSRAERRRRIKEEIMRSSQGQERGYYQRRLG